MMDLATIAARAEHVGEIIQDVFHKHGYQTPSEFRVMHMDDGVIQAAVSADGTVHLSTAALALPDDAIGAILAHEIGHIAAGHLYLNRDEYEGEQRTKFEMEADEYAAKHVGAARMAEYARRFLSGTDAQQRIEHLDALARREKAA